MTPPASKSAMAVRVKNLSSLVMWFVLLSEVVKVRYLNPWYGFNSILSKEGMKLHRFWGEIIVFYTKMYDYTIFMYI